MIKINENYLKLKSSYLFSEISKKVTAYQEKNPTKKIIRMGIGDVTMPLPKACIEAMHTAIDDMNNENTFRGYGPEQGYNFLREKIASFDYHSKNVMITADEIFISDGAKCDTGNIQEIFSNDIKIAIPDPVYPVYIDTNVMAGRTGENSNGRYGGIYYLDCNEENGFVPSPPKEKVDLIYLCFPNNPTGAVAKFGQLKDWVDYAIENKSLILFDAAYEAFVKDDNLPTTIYEVDGAQKVAIEFRSFSKTAGFTGTRCAFTVVPKECTAYDSTGKTHNLHALWNRRHTTKFNGVSYIVQRGAEAVYSVQGRKQVKKLVDHYLDNAKLIRNCMIDLGYKTTGGDNSPYIWVKTESSSWDFFDKLLEQGNIVCTPGVGFGACGENYIRFSAFNSRENVLEAVDRIQSLLKK